MGKKLCINSLGIEFECMKWFDSGCWLDAWCLFGPWCRTLCSSCPSDASSEGPLLLLHSSAPGPRPRADQLSIGFVGGEVSLKSAALAAVGKSNCVPLSLLQPTVPCRHCVTASFFTHLKHCFYNYCRTSRGMLPTRKLISTAHETWIVS